VGTMSYGKMGGEGKDKHLAYVLERESIDGPFYHQEWGEMKASTPIVSGGMNALPLSGFFENLGHSNVIQTSGGGTFGRKGGGRAGAIFLRQAEEAWKAGITLPEYALDHPELRAALETFQADSDLLFPGWRTTLSFEG
jgi:ribulose-bisphosphate carboxylase large chain